MSDDDDVIDSVQEARVKSVYQPVLSTGRLYGGGKLERTPLAGCFAANAHDAVNLVNMESGLCVMRVAMEKDDTLSCFAVRPLLASDGAVELLVASKSLQLKLYSTADVSKPVRAWKAHTMPASCMQYDRSGTLCAVGHTDGRVIVYDVAKNYVTHSFSQHSATVTALHFVDGETLVSCSQDSSLIVWDLISSRDHKKLAGHLGAVSDFCVVGTDTLVSMGRDRVLTVWNLKTATSLYTLPIYDSLESCAALGKDLVVLGGAEGKLRLFSLSKKSVVWTGPELRFAVDNLLYDAASKTVICSTSDHNIVFHVLTPQPPALQRAKVLIGDLDQITDVSMFGDRCERVAVATNSKDIKVGNLMRSCGVSCVLTVWTVPLVDYVHFMW
jgi:U3 small nucleolar RNA-associated protein 13